MQEFLFDGACVLNSRRRSVAKIRDKAPGVAWAHFYSHRSLSSQKYASKFKGMLESNVKIINVIKAMPLNSSVFTTVLCDDMGSEHKQLLHSKVCWLS